MSTQERARPFATVINAAGTLTRLSGGPLAPGVIEAMADIDAVSVDIFELQAHASRRIADATGAEAGLVVCGAAAGLLLAAAACMARLDAGRMNALPDTSGPNEIVVARGHRNGYDHALRAAGASLVEVGLPEVLAGAGIRSDVERWEYEAAMGPRTVALHYVASRRTTPALAEVVEAARARHLPVIVDAAAELPPEENLRRFIGEGADLVSFSGGKALGGPAATGILCGRAELIASAALQSLDVDVRWRDWRPPEDFIDKGRLQGLPRQGIGRCCKVGKHEVAGLLAALEHFRGEGDAARHARWLQTSRCLESAIQSSGDVSVRIEGADEADQIPLLVLRCRSAGRAQRLRDRLSARPEPVHTATDPFRPDCLIVNPVCLRQREVQRVAEALSELLS